MLKLSETIQMSFPVSPNEKKIANEASVAFTAVNNAFSRCEDQINIINNIFEKYQNIDGEKLHEHRGILNRYKQELKRVFGPEELQGYAIKALQLFDNFSADMQVEELINAFKNNIKEVGEEVSGLMDLMDNYKDNEFRQKVLDSIKNIQKKISQAEQLVKDRIIDFIDDKLISRDWASELSEKYDIDLNNRKSLTLQLFEERQNAISGVVPQIQKRPQSLNPADNQRVWSPTDLREVGENEDVGKNNPNTDRHRIYSL